MARKKGLTIGKTRSALYKSARLLGDVNAVSRGTIPQRLVGRYIGGFLSQLLGGLIRGIFGGRR